MKKVAAVAAIAVGLLIAAGCAVDEAKTGGDDPETGNDISEGLGSQDASADVKLVSFSGPDAIGIYTGQLEVTNHSSKTSDYYIEVNVESADGTVIGWSNALVQKLQPGAKALAEFQSADDGATKAVVTEVQRTASV